MARLHKDREEYRLSETRHVFLESKKSRFSAHSIHPCLSLNLISTMSTALCPLERGAKQIQNIIHLLKVI